MRARWQSWLGGLVDARPEEHQSLAWAFAQFLLLLAALYVVRPLRDEMGIQSGVQNMQWLFTGTFVGIAVVVPAFGWAATRIGRRALVSVVYVALAVSLAACVVADAILPESPPLAAFVFVWISVFNMLIPSLFWSLMADVFAPEQGRRLFGFIAAGGSIGALVGPTLATTLVEVIPPMQLLLVAAVLLVAAAACARQIRTAADASPLGGGLLAGFRLMFSTPLLRGISGFLLCMTWVSTIFYFTQASIIGDAIADSAQRTSLFAKMDLAVNATALAVQTFLTGRILRRVGFTVVLVALPVVGLAALIAIARAPTLGVLVVVQVARRAVNYALSKPAREALFTKLGAEAKYKGKNVVDTFVYRGGDVVAGWGFRGLQAVGLPLAGIAWVGVPVAIAWVAVARRLGRLAR